MSSLPYNRWRLRVIVASSFVTGYPMAMGYGVQEITVHTRRQYVIIVDWIQSLHKVQVVYGFSGRLVPRVAKQTYESQDLETN
jgi:hypothetical protein